MELIIQNFAKIKQAEIKIDGITVIAGENNTGKSTVGKILFSLFNSVSNIEEKIDRQRKYEIMEVCQTAIRNYYAHNLERNASNQLRYISSRRIADFVAGELRAGAEIDPGKLEQFCITTVMRSLPKEEAGDAAGVVSEMLPKVLELAELPLDRIYRTLISNQFESVFAEQSSPLFQDSGETKIDLIIKKKKLSVTFDRSQCARFETEYNIVHRAIYIDDPFILDDLSDPPIYISRRDEGATKANLLSILIGKSRNDLLETILAQEKMSAIQNVLNEVVHGDVIEKKNNGYYLTQEGLDGPIAFSNLSTGLKSFVLLKMLIENGSIKEKDVLVFDEPEIHLHPQWQLVYAELIVLLQKYFDLSIVVTTHSPYFLDALNLYSIKHKIAPSVNYYLSSLSDDGYAELENVSGDLESIYKKMVTPIRALKELRYTLGEEGGDDE